MESGRTSEQREIFSYVRELLRIRREHPALRGGQQWHLASDESSYVFLRGSEEESIVVAFNNAEQGRELRASIQGTPIQNAAELSTLFGPAKSELARQELHIWMPPRSLAIFSVN